MQGPADYGSPPRFRLPTPHKPSRSGTRGRGVPLKTRGAGRGLLSPLLSPERLRSVPPIRPRWPVSHNVPAVAGARPTGRVPRRAAAALGRRERQPSVLAAVPILFVHRTAASQRQAGARVRLPRLRAWTFFRSMSGCSSATSRSRSVAPSGSRLPCSQARTVSVLTFRAAAKTG